MDNDLERYPGPRWQATVHASWPGYFAAEGDLYLSPKITRNDGSIRPARLYVIVSSDRAEPLSLEELEEWRKTGLMTFSDTQDPRISRALP